MLNIRVNGTQLVYRHRGRGDLMILVHGSLQDPCSCPRQEKPFAARGCVAAYSRRFHHPNCRPAELPAYAAALIRGLDLKPAHLVCSSYGSVVALAAAEPSLVRSLVLAEPPCLPWLEHLPGGPPLLVAFIANVWDPARRAFAAGQTPWQSQRLQ